jgi:hypothetical protein
MSALSSGDDKDTAIASPIARGRTSQKSHFHGRRHPRLPSPSAKACHFARIVAPQEPGLNWSGDEFTA